MFVPMRQRAVIVASDITQAKDRHGKFPLIESDTVARVAFTGRILRGVDGSFKQARLEVDVPPEVPLNNVQEIRALDSFGVWHTAQLITYEESTNLAGNRVYYRTIYCE
jgi:hypothetical protein